VTVPVELQPSHWVGLDAITPNQVTKIRQFGFSEDAFLSVEFQARVIDYP